MPEERARGDSKPQVHVSAYGLAISTSHCGGGDPIINITKPNTLKIPG